MFLVDLFFLFQPNLSLCRMKNDSRMFNLMMHESILVGYKDLIIFQIETRKR